MKSAEDKSPNVDLIRARLLSRLEAVREQIWAAGLRDPQALRHTLAAMHHGWPLALHHELLAWEDALRAYQAALAPEPAAGEREPLVLGAKEAPWGPHPAPGGLRFQSKPESPQVLTEKPEGAGPGR